MTTKEALPAIEGGNPIVTQAVARRQRWGEPELTRLTAMVNQESLFYWRGSQTEALLADFRRLYPLEYCMPCSSGTAALHIAVAALRLQPGDEVIVPAITDMGSLIGILYQQLVPVFADVDPITGNIDMVDAARRVTQKTRAITPVHLVGYPCDMTAVMALAARHDLRVIEDCAQAWGAQWEGRHVGLMGDFGCYSFNEFKHLSCGDGGIVGTNSAEWGEGLSRWGDKHYDRVTGGRNPPTLSPNYRITEPQSAVAGAQLERHDGIVAHRRRLGQRLSEGLRDFPGITVSEELPGAKSSYWFLLPRLEADTVRVDRDTFVRALKAEGVSCEGAYIPQPVPGYPLFQNHDFFAGRWPLREAGLTSMDYTEMQFPQAENLLSRCITLALHEAMTEEDVDFVIAGFGKLLSYYAK